MTERVSTGIMGTKHLHGVVALVAAAAVLVFVAGCAQKGSPAEPDGSGGYRIVGSLAIAGYAVDVVVTGDLCLIAASQGGLVFVDVSDPANPEYLSTAETGYPATGCAYAAGDSLAFAAIGAQGIYVYDTSDVLNPVWQSNGQGSFTRDAVTRESAVGDYYEIFTADGYGLKAQECYYYSGLQTWFFRQASDESGSGVARGICLHGNLVLLAIEELGLSIYDVTDARHVFYVGSVDTPGEGRAVAASGDYAYVADWRAGLQVVDISDTGKPRDCRQRGDGWTGRRHRLPRRQGLRRRPHRRASGLRRERPDEPAGGGLPRDAVRQRRVRDRFVRVRGRPGLGSGRGGRGIEGAEDARLKNRRSRRTERLSLECRQPGEGAAK